MSSYPAESEVRALLSLSSGEFNILRSLHLCSQIANEYSHMSSAEQASLVSALEAGLGQRPKLDIAILSTLYDLSNDSEYIVRLWDVCDEIEGPFILLHSLFWNLAEVALNQADVSMRGRAVKWGMHRRMLTILNEHIDCHSIKEEFGPPRRDHVVVVSQQVLGLRHAPTTCLFDAAYSLRKDFGKEVTIVNFAILPTSPSTPFYPPFSYNYAFSPPREYQGESFPLIQRPDEPLTVEWVHQCCRLIGELRPETVFAVGSANVVADTLASAFPVVHLPTHGGLPMDAATVSVVHGGLSRSDLALVEHLGLDVDRYMVVSSAQATPTKGTKSITRLEFGIAEDVFLVVVVGNRLDRELGADFATFVDDVLTRHPGLEIVLIGQMSTFNDWVATNDMDGDRVRFLGYQEDIMSFYDICDAYLNPFRTGGGASAAYAMCAGLPVISMGTGDVGVTVGEQLSCTSESEMGRMIGRLIDEPDYRAEASESARTRFENELSDGSAVLKQAFSRLEAFVSRGTSS